MIEKKRKSFNIEDIKNYNSVILYHVILATVTRRNNQRQHGVYIPSTFQKIDKALVLAVFLIVCASFKTPFLSLILRKLRNINLAGNTVL